MNEDQCKIQGSQQEYPNSVTFMSKLIRQAELDAQYENYDCDEENVEELAIETGSTATSNYQGTVQDIITTSIGETASGEAASETGTASATSKTSNMSTGSDDNDCGGGGSSGPVSLSQILDRDVYATLPTNDVPVLASALQAAEGDESSGGASVDTVASDTFRSVGDTSGVVGGVESINISSGGVENCNPEACDGSKAENSSQQNSDPSIMYPASSTRILPPLSAASSSSSSSSTSSLFPNPAKANPQSLGVLRTTMGNGSSAAATASVTSQNNSPASKPTGSSSSPSLLGCAGGSGSPVNTMPMKKMPGGGAVYPQDYLYLKEKVKELKDKVKEDELKLDMQQAENNSLKRELRAKNEEITQLKRENHKLKSVLSQHADVLQESESLLSRLQDQHLMVGQGKSAKRQGVSGESGDTTDTTDNAVVQQFNKDFRTKSLLKDAINDNDFLKNLKLDPGQLKEIIEAMYPQQFCPGAWIIKEGDMGSHLYVSAQGELEVVKEEKLLGRISAGKVFGELAILYNCKRTASVKAVTEAKVWVLDRRVYQLMMKKTGTKKHEDNMAFLHSVPLFHNLTKDHLSRIADALQMDFYAPGSYVIRQGAIGDSFYILRSGMVKITKKIKGKSAEEEVRVLGEGSYFGEQALLKEECRTASVIAMAPGVECLVLDRDSFIQLIGDLSELREKDYGDEKDRPAKNILTTRNVSPQQEYLNIKLDDLDIIATLGVGGFGRVELVQYTLDRSKTFALKCLRKTHIVETQQQDHVYSEKRIMMNVRSPFICRLYKTYRDSKCVYMLMEACLGGEVWTILRDKGWFDEHTARFISACVIEALDYLHSKNIIYRDLKPENLLLDNNGYVKLVDFGFSKYLGMSSKTWTFCGTPEYVAPEIILNKGHDRAVDYWSVGVLLYELLTGTPPFNASDPMKTYNIILKGIDMISFPPHVTRTATSLIKRLCRENVTERLGYQRGGIQDIKKHRWFQGFDWEGLNLQCLTPPIQPKVTSPTDASNFDKYPRDFEVPPDESSGWDIDF